VAKVLVSAPQTSSRKYRHLAVHKCH